MSATQPNLPDHNKIIDGRYEKIAEMRAAGRQPFAWRFDPSHTTAGVRENAESLKVEVGSPKDEFPADRMVRLAGRAMTIRKMGKTIFVDLLDGAGRLQVMINKNALPEESFETFKQFADMGDIIGVAGPVFTTKTGELSVLAKELRLLTKSARPLPEKWHGLKDTEIRYRQRYADLIVNDSTRDIFRLRSAIVRAMREELERRGYMEVETPMMQTIHGGATARPFETHHNALDIDLYLRIAPELFLKRLVVGGFEKVYEINRNFRNEGVSTKHNPEFTMMELYTAYFDYRDTMRLTEEVLRAIAVATLGTAKFQSGEREIDFESPFRRVGMLDAVRETCGVDAERKWRWGMDDAAKVDVIAAIPAEYRGEVLGKDQGAGKSCDRLLQDLFEAAVEHTLIQPTFIVDYPKSSSPLTKSAADDPDTAERFELIVAGMELANAYSELNDPAEQHAMFKRQVEAAAAGDDEAQPMDEDYVRALEYGMPPASGLGVGVDRLVMLLGNKQSIREVILFPTMRPLTAEQQRAVAEAVEAQPETNTESES